MTGNREKIRVVVTGIGVVTPIGNRLSEFVDNLLSGVSGASKISVFDPAQLPTRIAAQVKEPQYIDGIRDRKVLFALAAANAAVLDAQQHGKNPASYYHDKSSVLSIGIGLELFSMPDMVEYISNPDEDVDQGSEIAAVPLNFLQTPSDICVHMICEQHQLTSPPHVHVSACAASTDAIGTAFHSIQSGKTRWALAGGTDSMINPLGVAGFCKLNALTRKNDMPQQASRPFDNKRDGFLLGEGAGFLVLEAFPTAQARGANIYAEIVGYGNSFDAHGISEPHPEGEGAYVAMQRAIRDAGITVEKITYVNAHGTSTPKNDVIETHAIKRLLGSHAHRIKISATKSMIGHLISASGAVETAAMLVCAQRGYIHPTINLDQPGPGCDLDYVSQGKTALPPGYILKNSFGFGGQNASLVFTSGYPGI